MVQETSTGTSKQGLSAEDFIDHPEVLKCLDQLNASGRTFVVSDVLDNEGHQYVNLVQKGGGVLGVALVGYTYILEKMGIRFMRLAGTSAGAINTALMTVIGEKKDAKSIPILKSICDLNFFDLVDGHPAAKWIIKKFITHEDFSVKIKRWSKGIFLTGFVLIALDFIFLGLQHSFPSLSVVTKISFVFTGFYFLLFGFVIFYISRLFQRLKVSGFGINPGNYFYDWIKRQLISNGVVTVSDLEKKASEKPELHLRIEYDEPVDTICGDVTFISSELVTQNKIQFPLMCNLFRESRDIDKLQPAGFIRASMAIPLFFESYFINDIPCTSEEVKKAWVNLMNVSDPPSMARFVDGGILSNFPINIFYNPKIVVPRLPSFGIDLDDSKPADKANDAFRWTFMGYLGRMFNTIRDYYDKDFLLKNKMYEKGIGKIPLSGFNWLNFFITDKNKVEMFILGAKAATNFLMEFDWQAYKDARATMQVKLNQEHNVMHVPDVTSIIKPT